MPRPRTVEEVKEIQQREGLKIKILPSKLVAVKKKKPNLPIKRKLRIVACGNMDFEESDKDTYASGADSTAVRCAIRKAALKRVGKLVPKMSQQPS